MPVNYTLPNWLHGGDPVGAYTAGAQIGLQKEKLQVDSQLEWARLNQVSQLAQQRLAQEQHQAEMELQVKQEVAQQAEARHAQELAVEKAYKDAEIGLKTTALQEKTTQAANQFAGQQKWKSDVLSLMDAGESQDDAIMKATLSNPQMLRSATPLLSALMKQRPENIQPEAQTMYTDQGEYPFLVNPKTGAPHFPPRQQSEAGQISPTAALNATMKLPEYAAMSGDTNLVKELGPLLKERARQGLAAKKKAVETASKVQRANELAKEHPDWAKADIVAAVNKEFSAPEEPAADEE